MHAPTTGEQRCARPSKQREAKQSRAKSREERGRNKTQDSRARHGAGVLLRQYNTILAEGHSSPIRWSAIVRISWIDDLLLRICARSYYDPLLLWGLPSLTPGFQGIDAASVSGLAVESSRVEPGRPSSKGRERLRQAPGR